MTSLLNPIHHLLLFFIFLFFTKINYSSSQRSNSSSINFCPDIERHSLLTFKQSLQDPDNLLSSWDGEVINCCKWERVVCNSSTGHVSHLHLQSDDYNGLGGKINPSLLNLKHLTYLDLSGNNFPGETIPSFIGSLSSLEYLNLSSALFMGKIPPHIGNLSNLHTLDLEGYLFSNDDELESGELEWLLGLSKLEYLNLNYANLSRASNWGEVINSLPRLLELHLSGCSIHPSDQPHHVMNNLTTSLIFIDVSGNLRYYDSNDQSFLPIPQWFFQLETLVSLDLSYNSLSGQIPTLSNTTKLQFLDLSYNYFNSSNIPGWVYSCKDLKFLDLRFNSIGGQISEAIGNLTSLQSLDLSENQLSGKLPTQITSLCRLQSLDLSYNRLQGQVEDSFGNMSGCFLRSLQFLDLNFNSIGGQISEAIGNLTSLQSLDLSENQLSGKLPTQITSLCRLQSLTLSGNELGGELQDSFGNMSECFLGSLQFLDLNFNSIGGQISEAIGNLTSLQSLDLSGNRISGKLPTQITSLCRLQSLVLSNNTLQGDLQDSFGNMSECFLGSLQFLDLSYNQLSGHLTEQFGEFKLLRNFLLHHNSLSGTIPISIGNSPSLEYLQLNDNKFTGNLPVSLGQLSKMYEFHVESNQLEGIVSETHFFNLSNLGVFSASGNRLTLSVGPNWTPPKNIVALRLGSWNLGAGSSQIPSWLQTRQDNILELDLSNTGISGTAPAWFFDGMIILNISHNNLHGQIPYLNSSSPSAFIMSWNKFTGSLPRIGRVVVLDLSHNLFSEGLSNFLCNGNYSQEMETLFLEGNRLSGELPDCWQNWPNLAALNLGNNTLHGRIPNSLGFLQSLKFLNLYGNNFSGRIPFPMRNCTGLLKMDLGRNRLDGNVPTWIGTSLTELKFLILRSNKFFGGIPSELCHLRSLQILDLSGNKITGVIPKCVHNLTAMATKRVLYENNVVVKIGFNGSPESAFFGESASIATKGLELEYSTILSLVTNVDLSSNHLSGEIPKELTSLVELGSLNLSRNQLSGSIPDSIGEMKQLESLDLSSNSLSGQIPNGFTHLSSLSFLNLSFNNLSGRIPQSTQLQTMEASRYIGNNLCGPPLTKNCSSSNGGDEVHEHEGEERRGEIEWMYVFLSAGYAVGFSGICSVLVLKKRWREAYFGLLERMWDKLYVYFHVWIQRF